MPRGVYAHKPLAQKHKDAISAGQMGRIVLQVTRDRISAAQIGRPRPWSSGPNHGNWKGGQQEYRGLDWRQQRRLALERDNHTCQRCDKTKEELGQEPDVHHKVPYRDTQDNSLDNLVSLCKPCHMIEEWRII